MPNAESLIVYEEVMESVPGDNDVEEKRSPMRKQEQEEQKNEIGSISSSSAEPLVADERVPVGQDYEVEDDEEGNLDGYQEEGKPFIGLDNATYNIEQSPDDLKERDVKI